MVRSIPRVHDDSLHVPTREGNISIITLGSSAWDTWVEHARSFRFETPHSSFTARKEQRPGGWYWYAYRRRHGTLHIAYLGKSEELTIERLHTVAAVLERAEDSSEETRHQSQQRSFDASLQDHHTSNIPSPLALSEARPAGKHNLPNQLTSLVGRESATATATALLRRPEVRLLSMIGTGGIGKTRLAIAVATELLEDFTDGISFVALAPLRDPDMVLPTIAHTLDLEDSGSEPVTDRLHTYLRDKHLLLVLDNFEHLMPAAPVVGELLIICPKLNLLVTSREVLHLRAEQQFSVPPLAVPDRKHIAQVQSLTQYPALDLFLQRARAVKHEFQLHETNAQALADICTRLDGLPLAIELAAARIAMFSPQALLARLDHRLQVLTHGPTDLPERQQTLRQTIQWSYQLLKPEEQRLFQRTSVFARGATLEAIEALCEALGDETGGVFDGVTSLLDKSLLQQTGQEDEEPRLLMLETLREYGLEMLSTNGEMDATRQAHAAYFLDLAEEAEPKLFSAGDVMWVQRLEREHDNLRAALSWLLEQSLEKQESELALRLSGALWRFWWLRGYVSEGRHWLKQVLEISREMRSAERAKAFIGAGALATFQDDFSQTEALCGEGLTLYRELGDCRGSANALSIWGYAAMMKSNYAQALKQLEEALALFREVDDAGGCAYALNLLASVLFYQGEDARALVLLEESLLLSSEVSDFQNQALSLVLQGLVLLNQGDLARAAGVLEESRTLSTKVGYKRNLGLSIYFLGLVTLRQGDMVRSRSLLEESLLIFKEVGERGRIAQVLGSQGLISLSEGDYVAACALLEESLQLLLKLDYKWDTINCLELLAVVLVARGEPARAVWCLSASKTLREAIGTPLPPVFQTTHEFSVASVRTQLGEQDFEAAWAEGRSMTAGQILAAQRGVTMPSTALVGSYIVPPASKTQTDPEGLTTREVEVLRLVAQGLTDEQVAHQLVISRHTVNSHLKAIYGKLGISSRSAATRYALQHHLL